MKPLIILPVLSLLASCSLLPTRIVDREVLVTVPCKIPVVSKPVMPYTGTGGVDDDIFLKTKKVLAELELRAGYEKQLEVAVKACQ